MVEEPAATPVARPPATMVATPVLEDVQLALAVMSVVELSLWVAVAVNCCVDPTANDGDACVTAMEVMPVTARVVLPLTPLSEAVMVVEPAEAAVARPAALMAATAVLDEDQAAAEVMSLVDASL